MVIRDSDDHPCSDHTRLGPGTCLMTRVTVVTVWCDPGPNERPGEWVEVTVGVVGVVGVAMLGFVVVVAAATQTALSARLRLGLWPREHAGPRRGRRLDSERPSRSAAETPCDLVRQAGRGSTTY